MEPLETRARLGAARQTEQRLAKIKARDRREEATRTALVSKVQYRADIGLYEGETADGSKRQFKVVSNGHIPSSIAVVTPAHSTIGYGDVVPRVTQ